MNKREARALGVERGYWIGSDVIQQNNYTDEDYDTYLSDCSEIEETGRQFSPFEFTAHDINAAGDRSDGLWEEFDAGIERGFERAWKMYF
jgi:hypothetical protein